MATVIGHMRDHPDTRLRIRVVPTYVDAGTVERLRVGLTGMATAVWLVLAGRVDVLHVHLSHGGRVIRKSPALWAARLRGVPAVIHAAFCGGRSQRRVSRRSSITPVVA